MSQDEGHGRAEAVFEQIADAILTATPAGSSEREAAVDAITAALRAERVAVLEEVIKHCTVLNECENQSPDWHDALTRIMEWCREPGRAGEATREENHHA